MLHVETRATREKLRDLEAAIVQAAALAMRAAVAAATESAKSTTRFRDKTGETRGSVRGEVQGSRSGFVVAGGAARLLEGGTRAHVIRGRSMLRFEVAGETFFRRMVRHPGTAPRPFMQEASQRGAQALEWGLELYVGEAIRRI